jgi:hypothetical protein
MNAINTQWGRVSCFYSALFFKRSIQVSLQHNPTPVQKTAGVTALSCLSLCTQSYTVARPFPSIAAATPYPGNKQPEQLPKTPTFGAKTAAGFLAKSIDCSSIVQQRQSPLLLHYTANRKSRTRLMTDG